MRCEVLLSRKALHTNLDLAFPGDLWLVMVSLNQTTATVKRRSFISDLQHALGKAVAQSARLQVAVRPARIRDRMRNRLVLLQTMSADEIHRKLNTTMHGRHQALSVILTQRRTLTCTNIFKIYICYL
jgi:hypothetical protein